MHTMVRFWMVLFLATGFFSPADAQTYFEINNFQAQLDKINLLGNAQATGSELWLTPDQPGQLGSCWYAQNKIDLNQGFDTEFTFEIATASGQKAGNGFAFIIQNEGDDIIGTKNKSVGLSGIKKAVALRFDTYSKNLVDLCVYDAVKDEFKLIARVHEIPEFTDGKSHFARIEYKDGFLTFFLDSYLFPVLSTKLDLQKEIGSIDGTAWLGFSSATSDDAQSVHKLLTWSLGEKVAPPADIVEEEIEVIKAKTIKVSSRKLRLKIWDDHRVDGDIVSLKYGDNWIVSEYKLKKKPKVINVTLTGFNQELILYANNVGLMPPNTAAISIYDGKKAQNVVLNADMKSSESIILQYVAPE